MPVPVSVNLSPTQFADGILPATVAGILAETGLAPARLDLEVTETILVGDNAQALASLHRLRAMGVSVSLDDFGTGATSLNSLRLFPFDRLKIDPCFTRDMAACPDARAIVRAVIGMGRARNMLIVAEGVETEAQLASLRDEGCDLVQGYAVSRPQAGGNFLLAPATAPVRELEAA
jgi:EAL domain-containing protein (putative c-di-GMP-specific phosphodiesterase class I)